MMSGGCEFQFTDSGDEMWIKENVTVHKRSKNLSAFGFIFKKYHVISAEYFGRNALDDKSVNLIQISFGVFLAQYGMQMQLQGKLQQLIFLPLCQVVRRKSQILPLNLSRCAFSWLVLPQPR